MKTQLLLSSPTKFIQFLAENNIRKFYFIFDNNSKTIKSSHSVLNEIAKYFETESIDFEEHEAMFFKLSPKHDMLMGAFIHRTNRGQAAGGVRYWSYDNMLEYFSDGMRLAKGMTHKNALAGLWWGGGKGVISHNHKFDKNDKSIREYLYKEYGKFLTELKGCYVTAEDVGTSVEDMENVFSNTRFTTCIPYSKGGSGNPSLPTARGVIAGMEAALNFNGENSLEGKTIAVQGLGHVAIPLIKFLFERKVKKVVACDIFSFAVEDAKKQFANFDFEAKLVEKTDNSILETKCDVFAPCATGAILNSKTIPLINAKIVCGAANNHLAVPENDDKALMDRGIIYVPDFLTNRMGIVNCADEQSGYVDNDPLIERHLSKDWEFSIHQTTLRVLENSSKTKIPTGKVAVELAHELSLENNPIYGHRSQLIIDSLVKDNWHDS